MPNDYSEVSDERVLEIWENTRQIAGPLPPNRPTTDLPEDEGRNWDAYSTMINRGWKLEPGVGWVDPAGNVRAVS